MHIVYYTWVLQNISQLIGIFVPKELIIFIVDFMRSTIIGQHTLIDIDQITVIPVQNDKLYLYYNTDDFLLQTHQFELKSNLQPSIDKYQFFEYANCISFILDRQSECIYLRKYIQQIDEFMQSDKIKKQLFGEQRDSYTYHSCIYRDKYLYRINMMFNTETEYVPITGDTDITKRIIRGAMIEFVYSLKIIFMPPPTTILGPTTYGICPEVKIIKYDNPWFYFDDSDGDRL